MAPSTKSGWGGTSRLTASCAMASAPTWGPLPCTTSRRSPAWTIETAARATPRARSSWSANSPRPAGARALPPIASTTVRTTSVVSSSPRAARTFVHSRGCANPSGRTMILSSEKPGGVLRLSDPCWTPPCPHEGASVAKIDGMKPEAGQELYDVAEKVFPDIKAEPGQEAWIFMHTVPYEGSVGLVNLLTATRLGRKGFKVSLVLYGPGVLMASGTRGYPARRAPG